MNFLTYALDFWCGEKHPQYFSPTENQVRKQTYYLKNPHKNVTNIGKHTVYTWTLTAALVLNIFIFAAPLQKNTQK